MSAPTITLPTTGTTELSLTFDAGGVTLSAKNPTVNGGQPQLLNVPITTIAKAVAGQVAVGGIEPPLLPAIPALPQSLLQRMSPVEKESWKLATVEHAAKTARSIKQWANVSLKPSALVIAFTGNATVALG